MDILKSTGAPYVTFDDMSMARSYGSFVHIKFTITAITNVSQWTTIFTIPHSAGIDMWDEFSGRQFYYQNDGGTKMFVRANIALTKGTTYYGEVMFIVPMQS